MGTFSSEFKQINGGRCQEVLETDRGQLGKVFKWLLKELPKGIRTIGVGEGVGLKLGLWCMLGHGWGLNGIKSRLLVLISTLD